MTGAGSAIGGQPFPLSVGVVVPVRGFSPFLGETLDAIAAEDPQEIVVVDDASPEPVRLPPGHESVRLLRRSVRGGPSGGRGDGERAMGTDLVAFCDGDDAWEPGSLALRVAALRSCPGAAVAFGRAEVVGIDGRPTGEVWSEPSAGVHVGEGWLRELFLANPIPVSSAVIRRSALAGVGGIERALPSAEDWDLWMRLALAGAAFVCVPDAVLRYRRHPSAMTADISVLAEAQQALHERYREAVDEATRRRAAAADALALARGRVRERKWSAAARLLSERRRAGGPVSPRVLALEALVRVPGARQVLGRRDPYRPRRLPG
jgi:glycosyltransferase involved in cell wall biosynthesis